ncbi:MAG: Uma2 family endonuclease [Chitinophagales bacterium]|nr:Uma2 family endonuclease [Chitinophagales bacterium]
MRQPKHFPNYTLQDYELWEGDWELIEGIPYSMSPSANSRHQLLATNLILQIGDYLNTKNTKCNCMLVFELDWRIDLNTVVRPDIAIVCEPIGQFIDKVPVLIVEILSKASAYADRIIKNELYAQQGVKFYIVIDPLSDEYRAYELVNQKYQPKQDPNSFQLTASCRLQVDFDLALTESKRWINPGA